MRYFNLIQKLISATKPVSRTASEAAVASNTAQQKSYYSTSSIKLDIKASTVNPNDVIKKAALKQYDKTLMFEDYKEAPETKINRAFGLLATSRWINRSAASEELELAEETLTESKRPEKSQEAIACAYQMMAALDQSKSFTCFYFFDEHKNAHQFKDEVLGFEEVEGTMSLLG